MEEVIGADVVILVEGRTFWLVAPVDVVAIDVDTGEKDGTDEDPILNMSSGLQEFLFTGEAGSQTGRTSRC